METVGYSAKSKWSRCLCQPNLASDLKLLEKLLISRTDSQKRSVLQALSPLTFLLRNLDLPVLCKELSFPLRHSSSVPDAELNEFGRRVDMNTLPWCLLRQGSHLAPALPSANTNRSFSPLSPLSIATSLTSKGLSLPKKFNSWSSKYTSLEETQYFLQNHPASV